ncbi:GspE/PulE family protein [Marininema halotolerans]|uniref:General secretion pathway protein E/type IV pilus assembly protein PilB n=1 Tax=Marininema halotolerans TaxID=1155944 RepID=A0A1I6ST84_9BACL|nr:GspE/PulE family protein [Marininema halotolerans]SFS80155.1 general secretion pathway protein E/type IV pilus assembly protein PilB [Marininema halotolerans]
MDITDYVSTLIEEAIRGRASDIHIEPRADHLCIRQRVDGFLVEGDRIEKERMHAIISRIKVMGHLDIGEKRLPQDGALTVTIDGERVDVRISSMPTLHGEKVVLRLLRNRPELLSLEELGMGEEEKQRLLALIQRSSGLLVVTGPTGAGKTTTLYAILHQLNRVEQNLVTLEDPVEFQLVGVNQIQIHPKAGLTFAHGLRAVLRQDPNIIMVGEIRDRETADIAIRAALTGHLVITTLHTTDASSTITRLLDMGIEPYRIAASLVGAVAQRLIRLICKGCRGKGCDRCQQQGYLHRVGAFEVVAIKEEFQPLIVERAPLSRLRHSFQKLGMRSLADAILEKVMTGETSIAEYHRVVDAHD